MTARWQVGVDIGGTFTDVVAFDPASDAIFQAKVRSRPDAPVETLVAALAAVGVPWDAVDDLVHGTTMVTNAIVENRLDEVALVATAGFADTLDIGRQNRRHLYRLDLPPKIASPIPDRLRFEVGERLDHTGEVLEELGQDAVETVARRVAESGVKAVAVALLHAYANPDHEARLGARLRELVPYVALSHRVSPEAREYERASTTALSAAVMPLAAGYLDRLEAKRPATSRLHLFHSAGGMASPEALRDLPLGLAFSGPAAGVAAASWVASGLDLRHVISFDMGGTTTDVCLVADAEAEIRSDRSLGGRPLRMPMVAVESIGAGGGSIARLARGALEVGPESAGASPGPACYGGGGTEPTVSDANLILGYLDRDRSVGGIALDAGAAAAALEPLADAMGTSVPEAALGVVRVTNASMARALRRVTVERGVDGRECALLAFGGAGPMHAVELARSFGIGRIVIPAYSSMFSALGCLTAKMSYTQQRTVRMASTAWDPERLTRLRASLDAHLRALFDAAGHRKPEVAETAAVRYGGQSYAVEIADPALEDPERLGAEFRARHEVLYGFATDEPWELVSLRRTLAAPRPTPPVLLGRGNRAGAVAAVREAPCWFGRETAVTTPRYPRAGLAEGIELEGPAIVEDDWSTVVLPPGARLAADGSGHLHIDVGAA